MQGTSGESGQLTATPRPARRALYSGFFVAVLLAALAGCASAPEPAPPRAEDYLLPGHAIYFGLNVSRNRDLVSYLSRSLGFDADVVLNRVDFVGGSLDTAVAGDPAFFGVALGRFPEGATRFALWRDREFRRTVIRPTGESDVSANAREGERRLVIYRQVGGPVEIAVPEGGVILVSNRSISDLIAATSASAPGEDTQGQSGTGQLGPAVVHYIRLAAADSDTATDSGGVGGGTDVVIVLPDPAALLGSALGLDIPRFPILQIALVATATADPGATPEAGERSEAEPPPVVLDLGGVFELENATQAALFGRLGRGFVVGFVRALGLEISDIRDTVTIETEGTSLIFGGIMVTPDELSGLAVRLMGKM